MYQTTKEFFLLLENILFYLCTFFFLFPKTFFLFLFYINNIKTLCNAADTISKMLFKKHFTKKKILVFNGAPQNIIISTVHERCIFYHVRIFTQKFPDIVKLCYQQTRDNPGAALQTPLSLID